MDLAIFFCMMVTVVMNAAQSSVIIVGLPIVFYGLPIPKWISSYGAMRAGVDWQPMKPGATVSRQTPDRASAHPLPAGFERRERLRRPRPLS
jgi:hypothetical protein